MTPVQVAAEVLHCDERSLTTERIKGGLTNESWCVQSASDAVVVRFSHVDEQALQLNRYSECEVLQLVQQAGIGAEVLLCIPERRLLVTRKLSASLPDEAAMRSETMLKRVAAVLRRLHQLPVPASVQRVELLPILRSYWNSIDQLAAAPVELRDRRLRQQAEAIAMQSAQHAEHCLCHNDVHHLNLLVNDQRLWLLDWEYAGVGDPYFDLAAVCCYHQYDSALQNQLLSAYQGQVRETHTQRLQCMCWLFDYIKDLWLAVRSLDTCIG